MSSWYSSIDQTGRLRISKNGLAVRTALLSVSVQSLSHPLCASAPDNVADLVDVACAVHAVDRLVSRRCGDESPVDQHRWSRHLSLQIPVRSPDLWARPDVLRSLIDTVNYFTEDDWALEFVPYGEQEHSPVQASLFSLAGPNRVGLFSGGLDSLIGLAAYAIGSEGGTLIPLAVGLSSRLVGRQKKILAKATHGRDRSHRIEPIVFPFRLGKRHPSRLGEEKSQRSRGFLFGSLAASAAWLSGADEVLVFENGIGAINLPLTQAQLGVHSTRSTHPTGLRKLSQTLSLILDREIKFKLPYLFATKGEACRVLSTPVFRELVQDTVSCDSFPLRISGAEQCGICTSCLLRRQALFEAGLADDTCYRFDLLGGHEKIPARHWFPLKDMLWQVHRLENALNTSDPWKGLVCEFPALREVAEGIATGESSVIFVQQQLVRLYRRYTEEWKRFPVANPEMSLVA